ncbi:MAG TPA: GDP-L-fucose synthase [Anaerolineales bacterium]|nr:GDP-L-fucose synthase [Anaerolineales bacterium]
MSSYPASDSFWTSRRICVTGGTGFLGSYVLDGLRARGALQVVAPSSREFNLVEPGSARRLLAEARADIVIHLAANVGGIGANRAHPAEFFYDNLVMGVQMQHESWKAGVEKFVAIGTVCAYPKFTPVPFREDDLWSGYPEETNAPYGLAKKMLLVQAQAYRAQYGFNAIYLVPVNLYGPRDNFDLESSHVIPALIRKFHEAQMAGADAVVVWGDGSPTREFLFAEDAAEGILLAAERYNDPEPVNLGSGQEISIRDLADKIARLVGFEGRIVWDTTKPNGQPRRALDTSRARERFGFAARTSLDDGLRRTVEWYRRTQVEAAPKA